MKAKGFIFYLASIKKIFNPPSYEWRSSRQEIEYIWILFFCWVPERRKTSEMLLRCFWIIWTNLPIWYPNIHFFSSGERHQTCQRQGWKNGAYPFFKLLRMFVHFDLMQFFEVLKSQNKLKQGFLFCLIMGTKHVSSLCVHWLKTGTSTFSWWKIRYHLSVLIFSQKSKLQIKQNAYFFVRYSWSRFKRGVRITIFWNTCGEFLTPHLIYYVFNLTLSFWQEPKSFPPESQTIIL